MHIEAMKACNCSESVNNVWRMAVGFLSTIDRKF